MITDLGLIKNKHLFAFLLALGGFLLLNLFGGMISFYIPQSKSDPFTRFVG